jgi:hypothetical protein
MVKSRGNDPDIIQQLIIILKIIRYVYITYYIVTVDYICVFSKEF